MNNAEINQALEALYKSKRDLEDMYIENGGEVTEDTEALDAETKALTALLNTEGVDSLGRWLKGLEDEKEAAKLEVDKANSRVKAIEAQIDRVKYKAGVILRATETKVVKGTFYSFEQATSHKTKVDTAMVDALYGDKVKSALADILPQYITVKLGGSVKAVPEGMELPEIFQATDTETSKFKKPINRKKKEVEE